MHISAQKGSPTATIVVDLSGADLQRIVLEMSTILMLLLLFPGSCNLARGGKTESLVKLYPVTERREVREETAPKLDVAEIEAALHQQG